jgi:hypothetical protein
MTPSLKPLFLAGLLAAGLPALAFARAGGAASVSPGSVSTLGSGAATTGPAGSSATGGSAAVGGTSVSTEGLGATTTGPTGTDASLSVGGTASGGIRDKTNERVKDRPNGSIVGIDRARASAGHGVWSRSATRVRDKKNGQVVSRTRSAYHEPGAPPVKSTSTIDSGQ